MPFNAVDYGVLTMGKSVSGRRQRAQKRRMPAPISISATFSVDSLNASQFHKAVFDEKTEHRKELEVWWSGEADNVFIYYLTFTLTLAFLLTVAITRSLRRKEPRVTELLHDENLREMLVTYLLSITTSLAKGSSCPYNVKVFMQLFGSEGVKSQFFPLKTHLGGKPMFQRGLTDIFMFKVPVSMGKIEGVRFILSGANKSLSWKVTNIQLFEPDTGIIRDLEASVLATEIIGYGDATKKVMNLTRPCGQWFFHMFVYHQWFAGYINTVRFGSFTEIVHVVSLFATLFNLLTFTQIAYIKLPPGGLLKDTFELNITSLLIASFSASVTCFILCLVFELLIRHVRCVEKNPGNAYHTVVKENICAKNMAQPRNTLPGTEEISNIWTALVMSPDDFEDDSTASMVCKGHVDGVMCEIPAYLGKLMSFIEQGEDKLKELERQRLALFEQGLSMLSLTISDHHSQASFLTCAQSFSHMPQFVINLPRFSQICLDRVLSGKNSLCFIMDEDEHKNRSYFDVLASRSGIDSAESKDEIITVDMTNKIFTYLNQQGSASSNTSIGKYPKSIKDTITTFSFLNKQSGVDIGIGTGSSLLNNMDHNHFPTSRKSTTRGTKYPESIKDTIQTNQTDKKLKKISSSGKVLPGSVEVIVEGEAEMINLPEVAIEIPEDISKEHIVEIDDINIEEMDTDSTEAGGSIPEIKLDLADRDGSATRLRHRLISRIGGRRSKDRLDDLRQELKHEQHSQAAEKGNSHTDIPDVTCTPSPSRYAAFHSSYRKNRSYTILQQQLSTSLSMPQRITPAAWHKWQTTQKVWCRKLVQAVHQSFKSCRTDLRRGLMLTSDIDIVMLEWCRHVAKRITAASSLRKSKFETEVLLFPRLVQLFWHLCAEVIMLTIKDTHRCLMTSEFVALADLVMQSHHVMMAVEHATDCIVFLINSGSKDMYKLLPRYLDLDQDLSDIRDRFIQMCFDLTVAHTDVTWAFFLVLLKDEDRTHNMRGSSLVRLREYVESQLSHEIEEDVIVKKMSHAAMEEAKVEVGQEFNNQEDMFMWCLLRQQTLRQLGNMIHEGEKKKQKFDEKHDLLPIIPKTRLEKLVERRKKKEIVDKQEMKKKKEEEKRKKAANIDMKPASEAMGRYIETLTYIRDMIHAQWKREGLKGNIPWGKYLAQALLHPDVQTAEKPGLYRFENFLHLKRTEKNLQSYLQGMVLQLADRLMLVMVKEHGLNVKHPDDKQKQVIVNDILVKVDTAYIVLSEDIRNHASKLIKMEASNATDQSWSSFAFTPDEPTFRADKAMRNQALNRTSLWNDENYSAKPKHGRGMVGGKAGVGTKREGGGGSGRRKMGDKTDTEGKVPNLQDLIDDLEPLKAYLKFLQKIESMRHESTLKGYLSRQGKKRALSQSMCINNIIDSYYAIHEGDDSHTFTKAALFRLEQDFVGDTSRPLPSFVKTVLVCVMLLMILYGVVYVSVTGGQFSTTQIQEWVCFYLLGVGLFGFVFEPIRAVIVGHVSQNIERIPTA